MAITERYVRADAAGGGDGTTDAASGANGAFTWAEMIAAAELGTTGTGREGYRYNVKTGTYTLSATSSPTRDGTATSPIIIRGFNSTPGDLDSQGRSSGGALNTTNYPVIDYTGGAYQFQANGAAHLILQNLWFKNAVNNDGVGLGSNNAVVKCKFQNSSTGANATAVSDNGNGSSELIDCDCDVTGASGTICAVDWRGGVGLVFGCRIKSVSSVGLRLASSNVVANCTIYECGTNGILLNSTTTTNTIINCTIVRNTADGIQFTASTTGLQRIINCCITDNANGIDFNSSTATKTHGAYNRTRGNSLAFTTAMDWYTATYPIHDITSGSADYTDTGTDDYSLASTSAAISQGPGYLTDIGSTGTPVVTAGGGGPGPRILVPLTGGAFPIY